MSHKPKVAKEKYDIEHFQRPEFEIDDYGMVPIQKVFPDIDEANPILYYAYFDYPKPEKKEDTPMDKEKLE